MSSVSHGLDELQVAALDAICERLIPSEGEGAGAREAGAQRYVLRWLAGARRCDRERYASGLGAVDAHASARWGAPLAQLPPVAQDDVLRELETGAIADFPGGCGEFFEMVRQHVLEGMFGDPLYGGNERLRGWDLLGYPGPRAVWGEADQRLDAVVARAHERRPTLDRSHDPRR